MSDTVREVDIELISRAENAAPNRPSLLFIHGGFHGAWCWDEHYLPWFNERGWAAHALSLRGHGASAGEENIRNWTLADYCDDVTGVIDRLDRPVVLIGHSMGGVVAERCWRARDDVVGIVLLAGSPLRPAPSVIWRLFRKRPASFILGQLLKDPVRIRDAMETFFFSPDLTEEEQAAYRDRLCLESPKAMSEVFSRPPPKVREDECRPVLVVAGANDVSIPLAAHEQASRSLRATLEVCPGAHDLMLDPYWQESASAIEKWLCDRFK